MMKSIVRESHERCSRESFHQQACGMLVVDLRASRGLYYPGVGRMCSTPSCFWFGLSTPLLLFSFLKLPPLVASERSMYQRKISAVVPGR